MKAALDGILKTRFPPVVYACGYGSAVFKQGSVKQAAGKMVDTILVVKNSKDWHEKNRERNSADYSAVPRWLMSSGVIEHIQRGYGGNMWFNTLIPCKTSAGETILMKYGVIEADDMVDDCVHWKQMYVAGRMQKPVLDLDVPGSPDLIRVQEAVYSNRQNALRTALALLSEKPEFEMSRLLEEIVNLSYSGDVRVGVAESPTKVKDIAKGSWNELNKLYLSNDLAWGLLDVQDDRVRPLMNFDELVAVLPKPFDKATNPLELKSLLARTVRQSSFGQTAKGVLSAGLMKSIQYAGAKVMKRFGS